MAFLAWIISSTVGLRSPYKQKNTTAHKIRVSHQSYWIFLASTMWKHFIYDLKWDKWESKVANLKRIMFKILVREMMVLKECRYFLQKSNNLGTISKFSRTFSKFYILNCISLMLTLAASWNSIKLKCVKYSGIKKAVCISSVYQYRILTQGSLDSTFRNIHQHRFWASIKAHCS